MSTKGMLTSRSKPIIETVSHAPLQNSKGHAIEPKR
jgi:hypothetical protein